MSGSASGTWWPLSSESPRPDSRDSTQNKSGDEVQLPTQELVKIPSFWSWSAGSAPEAPEPEPVNDNLADDTHQTGEQVSWWTSIAGLPTKWAVNGPQYDSNETQDVTKKLKSLNNVPSSDQGFIGRLNQQVVSQRSWFSWSFFSRYSDIDSDSESVDKGDIEAFREARSTIEAGRDSCHYAIFKPHVHSPDAYIAVQGTSSGQSPVRFSEKKQPVMPHQHLEKAMSDSKPNKPVENIGDLSKKIDDKSTNDTHSQNRTSSQKMATTNTSQTLQETRSEIGNPADVNDRQMKVVVGTPNNFANSSAANHKFLITPSLKSNLRVITLPTNIRLWGEALINKDQTSERHIYKSTPCSVDRKRKKLSKRVVVISIHSFLPTKFVRSVIGQSTGNASLIAANAANAVQRWAAQGGVEDLHVQTISLEGIGTISARTEMSNKLLRNWVSEINDSDFVFVAANSAASPVAVQVMRHMLENSEFEIDMKKIGFLSMSGGFHGPITGLDAKVIRRAYSYNEYDIIKEMFDLQRSNSELSHKLLDGMSVLCRFNVKLLLVGSADDQFIPVFSSVCHQATHPNIFKCLYVNENAEIPNFIIRLLSIILTMENVGYSGHHQLLRDLSDLSQGPLTSCASHGEIYQCPLVYDIGVEFFIETTSLKCHKSMAMNQATSYADDSDRNLYRLPWGTRGLINDLLQVKHIKSAKLLQDLLRDFNTWDPSVRSWRDIRQCFAALEDASPDDILL